MTRTNIAIDDDLVAAATRRFGVRTNVGPSTAAPRRWSRPRKGSGATAASCGPRTAQIRKVRRRRRRTPARPPGRSTTSCCCSGRGRQDEQVVLRRPRTGRDAELRPQVRRVRRAGVRGHVGAPRPPCPREGRRRLPGGHRIAPNRHRQRCGTVHRPGRVRVGDRIA
ncbi:MAG: type II toxin-antitoxin system VapB family antitoxin [Propionibacteriales bacterium]|nr:type II toxin-antitoxin system VapB family antitoxin [Propionibacteriales bacterium]